MASAPILRATPATLTRYRKRAKQTSLPLFPTAARHGTCEPMYDASAPAPVPDGRTKPSTQLVGIARLAASSPRADAKRGTEYFLLPVRSILNDCNSANVPFRFTVNPYRGCEFGCHYCYARYTHEFMEVPGDEFESKIYVKQNVGALAERDLSTQPVWGEHIAIGAATDPYQPAEREFGATRAILEKMAEREGLSLSITTKSNQVVRDIDLLKRISERSSLSVNLSITTVRAALARTLEPRAASRSAVGRCPRIARCRNSCRRSGHAYRSGYHRRRRRSGCSGQGGSRRRSAVVCRKRSVPPFGFAETFHGFHRRAISETRAAVPSLVHASRQCAGFLSRGNHRFGSESSRKIWPGFATAERIGKVLEISAVAAKSHEWS